ncbi:MAG TPA: hypothetical protein VFG42_04965 [Baekduia sp.]|uniref:hypothetical protein n=1 Tax=Baekduia sp. TaxID=2600305 RepID=UPI002D794311|nr:hypothetical protein [Baekduia sp.]HET6506116.1 hypothetical protein [Baekduia sp.]
MNLHAGPSADPLTRLLAGAALAISLIALFVSLGSSSTAAPPQTVKLPTAASLTPKPYGIQRLTKAKRFPAKVIPKVAAAKRADTLGGAKRQDLVLNCPGDTADLGTWCLQTATYTVPNDQIGKNDFAYAARTCVDQGGWLPSAAQLIGAAPRIKLQSTIDDNESTASIDIGPGDGLKDAREMTSDLFTTTAGDSAAGSEGVTAGSLGDPRQNEPNPVPQPADPMPGSLDYVTVYDNHDLGGFAGGAPVGRPEKFRCAFNKVQGVVASED